MDIKTAAWSNAGVVAAMVEAEIGGEISIRHDMPEDGFTFIRAAECLYFYYMSRLELLAINLDVLAKSILVTWKGLPHDNRCGIACNGLVKCGVPDQNGLSELAQKQPADKA